MQSQTVHVLSKDYRHQHPYFHTNLGQGNSCMLKSWNIIDKARNGQKNTMAPKMQTFSNHTS